MRPFKDLQYMCDTAEEHGHDITPTQQAMHAFLWERYQELGSCQRVAPLVGVSANCVQQHLRQAGYPLPSNGGRRRWNPELVVEFHGQTAHYTAFREHWHPELKRENVYNRLFVNGWPPNVAFAAPLDPRVPWQERHV